MYSNIPENLRKTRDILGGGRVPRRTTICHEGGGSKSGLKKATWFVYGPLGGIRLGVSRKEQQRSEPKASQVHLFVILTEVNLLNLD